MGHKTEWDRAGRHFAGGQSSIDFALNLVNAPLTLTNALQADGFIAADTSYRQKIDLQGFKQVRLTAEIKTESASANSPKLQLRASLTDSTTVSDYVIMGSSSVEVSMFTGQQGKIADSGWIDILFTFCVPNVYLGLMNIGGDGAADPVVNMVTAWFQ